MSIPLLFNLEPNSSEHNLSLSKKSTSNPENVGEKNKHKYIIDINNHITRQVYFFKDEILKEVNEMIDKLIIKVTSNFNEIDEKVSKNDEKFNLINERIDKILETIVKYEPYGDKIHELFEYKIKNEKDMLSHLVKFNDIKNEMRDMFNEYEGIIKKYKPSEVSEEIVGERRKFKTYPELMKYLYQNISQFNTYKEKSNLDFKGYKSKLDSTIFSFKNQINTIIDSMKNFTTTNIKESEGRIKGIINLFDERIVEIRSETNKYTLDIKKENENFLNEAVEKMKEEINKQIYTEFLSFNDLLKKTQKKFEENISECNKKFSELKNDFAKYKLNEDKKYEIVKMVKANKENILNKENISVRNDTRRNMTQREFFKPLQNLNNNESHLEKNKRNSIFNVSNAIKEINNETKIKKEEKIFENSKDNSEIKNSESKSFTILKKKMSNPDINNTYRINRISQTSKMKKQNNFSQIIKDNNNKEEKIYKSLKSLNELKDKDFPKIEEIKQDDNINQSENSKKFILKLNRSEKKNKTSSFFTDKSKLKRNSKRILSTINIRKKKIILKENDNSQTNLEINNYIEKLSLTKREPIINQKLSTYDVTFIPYKNYDRNKILKMEESKNSFNNLNENIMNNINGRKISTAKNKKVEYSYINSKGEISNVIEIPPPENAIFKSIFAIE
jgi:hypothetical protein